MADIAREFSPVVVFASGEARPTSSDRIRSASTRRTSRISSAVSTVEHDSRHPSHALTPEYSATEQVFEQELKQELKTPLSGIDLLDLINDKISKLDRALRSMEAPSDANKNQALITSEKLRAEAVQNGQARQQVQQFAGLLAIKSTFQDQITTTVKPKNTVKAATGQDQSTLLEIFQYPGFEEDRVTPLPFDVSLQNQVMQRILPKRFTHPRQAPHVKPLIQLYHSDPTKSLILDIFWWIFLEYYQHQPKIQAKLMHRASKNYVSLLLLDIDLRYRDKCFQVYPSLLAETVFACFKVCFPASIKQMPIDAEAAGKSEAQNKESHVDLGNLSDTPGQRMKELVNLDAFKNSITNVCQLWLGGIPAPPRRYEHWRSKLVQQEKIKFVESSPTETATNVATSTTGSSSAPPSNTARTPSSTHLESNNVKKRKDPHALLDDMYKHTFDPVPDRRVFYEDYLFDLNGYSPLTEKFLRSSHMLRQAGTQLFIPHPQITHVPSVSTESYNQDIKRAARVCRLLRAKKVLEREEANTRRRRLFNRARITTSKTRDEVEKEQRKVPGYRQQSMNTRSSGLVSISQLSFKSHL